MREVQPEINLLVSPSADRLAFKEPVGSPDWTFPEEVDDRERADRSLTASRTPAGSSTTGVAGAAVDLSTRSPTSRRTSPRTAARVGSVRPSALLYTNGIGATVDLPHLVGHAARTRRLGADLRAAARPGGRHRRAATARARARRTSAHQVAQLRKPPWAPEERGHAAGDAIDLGIPGRIFPQWLRCTGCDLLAPVSHERSTYRNTNRYRPDQAQFVHEKCTGWAGQAEAGQAA